MTNAPLSAQDLWTLHREILGGVSSATGAPLPEPVDACPPGAQAAHWGFAYLVSRLCGAEMPSRPEGLGAAAAARVATIVDALLARIQPNSSPPLASAR